MMKEEKNRYTATSYPTQLVWLLSILGLYTTAIMVTIVLWGTSDVREQREKLSDLQSRFTALYARLETALGADKWDLVSILEEGRNAGVSRRNIEQLVSFTDNFNIVFQLPSFDEPLRELSGKIRNLADLRSSCLAWRRKFEQNVQQLPAMEQKVSVALSGIDATIGEAETRHRRQFAARIENSREKGANRPDNLIDALISENMLASGFASVKRGVFHFQVLVEKIQGLEEVDQLVALKDASFLPLLLGLRTYIEKIGERDRKTSDVLRRQLTDLEATIFGEGYEIADDSRTITPGAGMLYNAGVDRLKIKEEQKNLRSAVFSQHDSIHGQMGELTRIIENHIAKETTKIETALKNVWQIILIVGTATGIIFLFISYRIILEIKAQIKAIEDTNIELDKQTKALLKSEKALQESEERLQYLSSNLMNAQEQERRRIALELHDELGQSMAALKLQVGYMERKLGSKEPEAIKEECRVIRGFINEIIENVRRLSRDLSPVVLDDLGLKAAMEYLAGTFSKMKNMNISIIFDEIDHFFSQDAQRLIYRIIQEALTNIAKHAQATEVRIEALKKKELVCFQIADNGIGFNLDEVTQRSAEEKGMGLAAMVERVRILGGSIDFKSRRDGGTVITFTAPVFSRNVRN